jgi:hypothetical protein
LIISLSKLVIDDPQDLSDYYIKTETYTQDEVDALIPVLPTVYYTKDETYTQDEVDALIPVIRDLSPYQTKANDIHVNLVL